MNGRSTTSLLFALADAFVVLVMFNIIAFLRGVTPWGEPLFAQLLLPGVCLFIAVYSIEGYHGARTDFLSLEYASQHIIATVGAMLVTLLVTFVLFPADISVRESRIVIGLGYVTLIPITLGYRRLWYLRVGQRRKRHTVIFVGDPRTSLEFAQEFAAMGTDHSLVCCHLGDSRLGDLLPLREALALVNSRLMVPEAIVLQEATPRLPSDISEALVSLYFNSVPVYTLELFHETYWRKIPRYRLNHIWLFQEGFRITREPVFEHLKRIADLFLAGFGLLLFAPLLILAAVAIFLEGGGSVLFTQTRVGRNRVPFRMYKLRTMRSVPDGALYTKKDDNRITRVGRILRVTRLDEVPQLVNVLRGDMSLIGPRAEWDRLVERYEKEIPCYHFRHLVKPGITGWAQVNYPYGASMEDTMRKLEYDLFYIRHFSFRLDATIVLKTIHIMLFGKGQ